MTTNRHVNPLNPQYVLPGHSEPDPIYDRNPVPPKKFGASTTDFSKAVAAARQQLGQSQSFASTQNLSQANSTQNNLASSTHVEVQPHEYGYAGSNNTNNNNNERKTPQQAQQAENNTRKTPQVETNVRKTPLVNENQENKIDFYDGGRKIPTPLLRNGENIVSGGKPVSPEYVPAQRTEDNAPRKQSGDKVNCYFLCSYELETPYPC